MTKYQHVRCFFCYKLMVQISVALRCHQFTDLKVRLMPGSMLQTLRRCSIAPDNVEVVLPVVSKATRSGALRYTFRNIGDTTYKTCGRCASDHGIDSSPGEGVQMYNEAIILLPDATWNEAHMKGCTAKWRVDT